MNISLNIKPDITEAETLPATFYKDQSIFDALKENVFVKSWQWIGDKSLIQNTPLYPFYFLEHFVDEPLLLSRIENDEVVCLSNVCTHRGNILLHHPTKARHLLCGYHGRRFKLNGQFDYMPEFSNAENFPRPCDHLKSFPVCSWDPFIFIGLEPSFDFNKVIEKMKERVGFLPLHLFKYDAKRSKDYLVNAHWALYCDNYLEGFHIPFVHHDLNAALDYGQYITEIYDYCNLQIGYTNDSTEIFDLPEGHPDAGKNVAAYYYWVFPNMMFNFYPWGLSINIVKPISINKTKVSFLSYVYDESKIALGAGAALDKVEREDEFVVENVHRGLQSRYYQTGRFSPKREKGVHHFHSLLAKWL